MLEPGKMQPLEGDVETYTMGGNSTENCTLVVMLGSVWDIKMAVPVMGVLLASHVKALSRTAGITAVKAVGFDPPGMSCSVTPQSNTRELPAASPLFVT